MRSKSIVIAVLALTAVLFWRAGFRYGEAFEVQTDTLLYNRVMVEYRTPQEGLDAAGSLGATGFTYFGPGEWWLQRGLVVVPHTQRRGAGDLRAERPRTQGRRSDHVSMNRG